MRTFLPPMNTDETQIGKHFAALYSFFIRVNPWPQNDLSNHAPRSSPRQIPPTLCGLTFKRAVDEGDGLPDVVLFRHPPLHQLAGMQDGAVIASAKGVADFVQRSFR